MEQNQDPNFVSLVPLYPGDLSDDEDSMAPLFHPIPSQTHEVCMSEVGYRGDDNDIYLVYKPLPPEELPLDLRRRFPSRAGNDQPLSPDPTKTVCATFHQNSMDMFLSEFRGQHSTSIALTSILINSTRPVHTWTVFDMNTILHYGAFLHRELVMNPNRRSCYLGQPQLALREVKDGDRSLYILPELGLVGRRLDLTEGQGSSLVHNIYKSKRYYSMVHATSGSEINSHRVTMETAMDRILDLGYQNIMISVDGRTGALMKDEEGNLRYFDPHCCNKVGRRRQVGTAVLLTFDTTENFIKHIRGRLGRSDSTFEMFGVEVKTQRPTGGRRRRDV